MVAATVRDAIFGRLEQMSDFLSLQVRGLSEHAVFACEFPLERD